MRTAKRLSAFILACLLTLGALPAASAVSDETVDQIIAETAASLCEAVPSPVVGTVGGEWAVLGLARGGCEVPEGYWDAYGATVEKTVADAKGVLHPRKYTEYSRVVTALSAIGRDARSVGGYDLTKPLGDYEKTIWQGINGAVWALIALDSRSYPMPQNGSAPVQATRQMYVDFLLDTQREDGGWGLSTYSTVSNGDMTAMALQALAKYRQQEAVEAAVGAALAYLAAAPRTSCESTAQVITALCELGIPLEDSRFAAGEKTLLDELLDYRTENGFCHQQGGEVNQMATEQALYALVACQRVRNGQSSLYRMDSVDQPAEPTQAPGFVTRVLQILRSIVGERQAA